MRYKYEPEMSISMNCTQCIYLGAINCHFINKVMLEFVGIAKDYLLSYGVYTVMANPAKGTKSFLYYTHD